MAPNWKKLIPIFFLVLALISFNLPISFTTTTPTLVIAPTSTHTAIVPSITPSILPSATLPQLPSATTIQPSLPSPTVAFSLTLPATTIPTATVTPVPTTPVNTYAVILVAKGETLAVRHAANPDSKPIDSLPYNAKNILITGQESVVNVQRWVEIQRPGGGTGWVYAFFLSQFIPSVAFCADQATLSLLASFIKALNEKDGKLLSSLVSPVHGLNLHFLQAGTIANYDQAKASWVFDSTYQMHTKISTR